MRQKALTFFYLAIHLAATLRKSLTSFYYRNFYLTCHFFFYYNIEEQNKLQSVFYFNQKAKTIEISFKQSLILGTKYK